MLMPQKIAKMISKITLRTITTITKSTTMMTPRTVRRVSKYASFVAIGCVIALSTSSGQLVQVDAFVPTSLRSHQQTLRIEQRHLRSSSPVNSRKYHGEQSPFSFQNPSPSTISRIVSTHTSPTALSVAGGAGSYWIDLAESVFRCSGTVPFFEALGINALLFLVLQKKLFTMLTPSGFIHSMALGTMLWSTLGW
jgi:hypothetical protein